MNMFGSLSHARLFLILAMSLVSGASHAVIQTLPTQFSKKAAYKTHGSYATDLLTGTATYTYPLETSPGRNGLQPSLALTYSSGSPNGCLGLGWNFPQTMIERDIEYTPDNPSDDTFRIQSPGGRFDLVYIPDDGQYHTELESYLWIKKQTGGEKGDYWFVKSADGMMMECGRSSDSALQITTPQGTSFVSRWYINKITDAYGNSMIYRYDQVTPGQVYLREIAYNNDEARKVVFSRESRPEGSISIFRDGYESRISQRVKQVEMRMAGSPVRRYDLGYTASIGSGRSLLSSIREFGKDGTTALPPTQFDYVSAQEALGNLVTRKSSYPVPTGAQQQVEGTFISGGDFNGDSFTDVLIYQTQGNAYSWRVMLTGRDGFGEFATWRGSTPINNSAAAQDQGNFTLVANFDRDGRSDVLFYDASASGGTVKVMRSTGTGFDAFATWNTGFLIANDKGKRDQGNTVQAGDFNGDGLTDLFFYQANDSSHAWKVALNTGSSFHPFQSWRSATPLPISAAQRAEGNRLFMGDFNGDGLTDLCIYQAHDSSYTWRVSFSTGDGFTELVAWITNHPIAVKSIDNQNYGNFATTGEFNADGMTDILYYDGRPGANDWKVIYSTGTGFSNWVTWRNDLFIDNTPQTLEQGSFLLGGDFSSVGRTEFLVYRHRAGAYDWRVISPQGRDVDLLKTIHEELGGRIEIAYAPTNQFDNTGEDGLPGLPFVREVVARVSEDNGMAADHHTTSTTTYDYQGGRYDFARREFLGFRKVRATNAAGHYNETWFHQDYARKGKPYRTESYARDGALFGRTESYWISATLARPPGGRDIVFPYLVRSSEYVFDGNNTCKAMYVENPSDLVNGYVYGQPKWTRSYGDMTPLMERRFEYDPDVDRWILGKVMREQTVDGEGRVLAQTWRDYNTQGDQTRETQWLTGEKSDPANPVRQFEYDSYGNLVLTRSPLGHENQTEFDPEYHTFPVKLTNALGQVAQTSYDQATGKITESIDINGRKTINTYDYIHRLVRVTDPKGALVIYEYERDGSAPECDIVQHQEQYGGPGTQDSYEYMDGFGRTIQTKAEGTAGKWIAMDLDYDERGLTQSFSNPYFASTSTYTAPDPTMDKTVAQYDPAERVTRIFFPEGSSRRIAYDDWATTHTDANGHTAQAIKDGRGNLLRVIEHNQGERYYTQYRYDLMGHLTGITDAHGNIWTLTYDPLGRRTDMDDPDMGHWTYEYDKEGNIVRQTDAKRQAIEFEYDVLNRLTRKRTGELVYAQRTYDQGANGIGRLSREDHFADGAASGYVSYIYDELGRKISETKQILGKPEALTTGWIYDALGRPVTMTYPDGEHVIYTYNIQGLLESMGSSANNFVKSMSYNAGGQPFSMILGNDARTDYEYTSGTLRLSRLHTWRGTNELQNFIYSYDSVGNITRIQDTVHTSSAMYEYDDLNRLINAWGAGWSQSFGYNAIGNMMRFTDERGVTHHRVFGIGAGPHALAGERGVAKNAAKDWSRFK